MSDFLDSKKAEIKSRLDELKEAVDEYHRLQAALDALDGVSRGGSPAATSSDAPRRGRPRGTGTRAQEAIAAVTKEPGLTAGEIADRLGINQNYLYRVLPALEQDGKLQKRGRGWYIPGA
ncbi:MAG: winged helix-turn-helix transcriptional regulator [Solirubrobacteraceae bacterium]|nr:winged helix-turn-helix transcriptional regulator [Solirubrobacteraceae bacterium]